MNQAAMINLGEGVVSGPTGRLIRRRLAAAAHGLVLTDSVPRLRDWLAPSEGKRPVLSGAEEVARFGLTGL